MGPELTIGVVTVTYNSVPVLDDFLRSLSAQSHGAFILYAVDSGSKDASVERLRSWGDSRLRLILNETNVGIAEGNNQGTRAALDDGCDVVLYLNNDVEFAPSTFAMLLEERERLGCDMIAPKILAGDGIHIWSAGGLFSPAKGYLPFHIGEGEVDHGQYDLPQQTQHSPACCLMVLPSVFAAIGMMDPRYFVYHDDSDFTFRAWRHGLTLFYTPKAVIVHKISSLTGGASSPFSMRYNTRGHIYFMLKNLGPLRCLLYLPAWELRLLYKLVSRSIGRQEFAIRQRAFFEGIGVWAS